MARPLIGPASVDADGGPGLKRSLKIQTKHGRTRQDFYLQQIYLPPPKGGFAKAVEGLPAEDAELGAQERHRGTSASGFAPPDTPTDTTAAPCSTIT